MSATFRNMRPSWGRSAFAMQQGRNLGPTWTHLAPTFHFTWPRWSLVLVNVRYVGSALGLLQPCGAKLRWLDLTWVCMCISWLQLGPAWVGLAPKSCKYMKIYWKPSGLDDHDPNIESRFSSKIMQIHCKPGGLQEKDPKTESGFSPKIMQKQSKPGSLEEQDPKSEIFKIEFGPKIPAPTKLWKCQQVMLNVHLLAKSIWIWSQDHANEL